MNEGFQFQSNPPDIGVENAVCGSRFFNVLFHAYISLALKTFILADISENWKVLELGVLYHLGGEIADYWLERSGETFHVPMADWQADLVEVEVS